jgi:hypothetical protein
VVKKKSRLLRQHLLLSKHQLLLQWHPHQLLKPLPPLLLAPHPTLALLPALPLAPPPMQLPLPALLPLPLRTPRSKSSSVDQKATARWLFYACT